MPTRGGRRTRRGKPAGCFVDYGRGGLAWLAPWPIDSNGQRGRARARCSDRRHDDRAAPAARPCDRLRIELHQHRAGPCAWWAVATPEAQIARSERDRCPVESRIVAVLSTHLEHLRVNSDEHPSSLSPL